jgi:hypothetical protein
MTCVNCFLGVKQRCTCSYHPSTNGQYERFNRELCIKIAHYAATQHDSDLAVAVVTKAYNDTIHSSTGFAPKELALSRPRRPVEMEDDADDFGELVSTSGEYHHDFLKRVERYGRQCRETLVEYQMEEL